MRRREQPKTPKIRLADFIKVIKATEDLMKLESMGKGQLRSFLEELRATLNPYKNLDGKMFLELLRDSLLKVDPGQLKALDKYPTIQLDVENLSLDELKNLLTKNTFTKEQLLFIGEKRFSLSKGTLRKSRKEEVLSEILNAIRNIETLDAIKRKAAE